MNVHWLLSAVLLIPSASAAAESPATDLNPAQSVGPVLLSAIQSNYERLQGVELTINRTLFHAGVTEPTELVEKLPSGTVIKTSVAPQQTVVERIVILMDRLRIDQGGDGTSPAITYWFDGVRWTEANASHRRILRMATNQLGGRVLDPRESIGLDPRTSIANLLAQPALKEALLTTNGTISQIATATDPGGQKLLIDFDAKHAMLPVRSQLFHLNGALARDTVITYAKVAERDAWVIQGITQRVYEENVDGLATPEKWKQELLTIATCQVLDRDAAEKLLAPVVPEGYREIDFTDPATMERKAVRQQAVAHATNSPLKWFIIAHLIAFAAAAAFFFWRRRHTTPV